MDLDAYIVLRRDTSGCKPCWVLIEFVNGLDLPDSVMEHEAVQTLGEATNDVVSWSNVRVHLRASLCFFSWLIFDLLYPL